MGWENGDGGKLRVNRSGKRKICMHILCQVSIIKHLGKVRFFEKVSYACKFSSHQPERVSELHRVTTSFCSSKPLLP